MAGIEPMQSESFTLANYAGGTVVDDAYEMIMFFNPKQAKKG
jgi:hypothetical protein